MKARWKRATYRRRFVSAVVVGLLVSGTTIAQEQHESTNEGHEHGFHKNVIGGFVGFTGEDNRFGNGRERALTLGFEYERRFSEAFGFIVEAERAFGDLDFTVITLPLVYHRGPWSFSAGPGVEIPDHGEDEFVFRVASAYAFDRGGYEFAPKVGLDFVASEIVFFGGLVMAFGF